MYEKVIAIIPARGGSKAIPKKNIRIFCGKPLIAWTILQAKETPEIDSVYVSSDSDEILQIVEGYGAKKIRRPDAIAGDKATSESAIDHALKFLEISPEIILMLQPTSPLRKPDDLSNAIRQFRHEQWDSGFSGALLEDFLTWRKNGAGEYESINYDYRNRGRRQDRQHEFVENGSIYLFKPEILIKNGNRLGGKIGVYLMDFWQSFELDKPEDWDFLETLFQHYLKEEHSHGKR